MQSAGAGEEFLHRIAAMDGSVVQQNDQMAADLAQQMAEEGQHFFSLDVVLIQVAVQRTMETLGADRNAGDGGDPVVAIPITQKRCLSHRAPGLSDRGDQEEAGFVDEHDVGCQPRGVFFTRGHTVRFHSAIAGSSRSTARLSGFWWLHPIPCRSLPT